MTLIAGCGGGQDPGDTVDETVTALAEGNGQAVCENLIGESDDKVTALVFLALAIPDASERISDPPQESADQRCAYVAENIGPAIPNIDKIRGADIADVDIAGDEATVDIAGGTFNLEERDGDWKLTTWGPLGRQESTSEEPSQRELDPPGTPPEGEYVEPLPPESSPTDGYLECIDPVSYEFIC